MDYLVALAGDPTVWAALATLVVMEIVLGIDNLIFISILTNKLPEAHRAKTQRIGIGLALIMRIGLLGTVALIVRLTTPIFTALGHDVSWRDLILIARGQILVLDLVFSIDSIVTAVGMTEHIPVMFVAVIAAVAVMMFAAGPLSRFIAQNPTVVMLALGFLLWIGMP